MDIDEYVNQIKNIQSDFLLYIDDAENCEENYQNLVSLLEKLNIRENKNDLELFLKLIIQISNDHYRTANFFSKIEKILSLFKEEIKRNYTNIEIFSLFKSNKRLLLYLLEEKLMFIEKDIYNMMLDHTYSNWNYSLYFSPEISLFLLEEINDDNYKFDDMQSFHGFLFFMKPYIKESLKKNPKLNLPEDFYEKRKIGENESEICELIRSDSIEQFIIYVERNEIPADFEFDPSIYETNMQLINGGITTLIEYAAFFGSVQIFKYLVSNGADMYPSLWNYAVHGNNPELFAFLEDKKLPIYYESMFARNSDYTSTDESNEEAENDKEESDNQTNNSIKSDNTEENFDKISKTGKSKVENDNQRSDDDDDEEEEEDNNNDDDDELLTDFNDNEYGGFASKVLGLDDNQSDSDEISDFDNSSEKILKEAIKCHHNELANYIIKNYVKNKKIKNHNENRYNKSVNAYSFRFYNFDFLPEKFTQKFIFFYACQYGYYKIVTELMKSKKVKYMIIVVCQF